MNITIDANAYQILNYLIPTNKISIFIVIFLILIFLGWLLKLIYSSHQLRMSQKQMLLCEDIEVLLEAQQQFHADNIETGHEEIFSNFCNNRSVNENLVVIKHLKNIFLSGCKESRLEVDGLLNHAKYDLFKSNNLLRSILALFIILGLLGTLFGLADSMAQLSPMLDNSGLKYTNEGISNSLIQLLSHIKNAFAPSIWGVLFTVIGVLIYGFYLRFVCGPVNSTLERLTLTVWVPQLYPTTSQKLNDAMNENFESAVKVAQLADSIREGVSDFSNNLQDANNVIGSLSSAVSDIHKSAELIKTTFNERLINFSDNFLTSVSRLTSFQDELHTLYQKMIDESNTFRSNITKSLDDKHYRFDSILKTLKLYEDAYITEREKIDVKLQQFIEEATESNKSITSKNLELMGHIKDQLTSDLEKIDNNLSVNLGLIQQSIGRLDVPMSSAAEKIEGSYENFCKRMETIVTDMQNEIKKQNSDYASHITSLTDVKQRVGELLSQLIQNSNSQAKEVNTLNNNVNKLTGDISSLSISIQSLSSNTGTFANSVTSIEKNIQILVESAQGNIKSDTFANVITELLSTVKQLQKSVEGMNQSYSAFGVRKSPAGAGGTEVRKGFFKRIFGKKEK